MEKEDIFGDAYEYLLEQFADETKKKGGKFFTPREIVKLLVNISKPKEGMMIYDPTCGSGGMLVISRLYVEKHGENIENLTLEPLKKTDYIFSIELASQIVRDTDQYPYFIQFYSKEIIEQIDKTNIGINDYKPIKNSITKKL